MTPVKAVVHTACPLDCPDACALDVEVTDGKITKVNGSTRNPLTQGFICSKVRQSPEVLEHPTRLLYPEVRIGPKGAASFHRVSWDEALGLLSDRLREARSRWGGESILPFAYGGSNGLLTQDTTDARLFRRLGASRLLRTVCSAPSTRAATGLYGKMPGVSLRDYPHAQLVVLWGVNPSTTGIHFVPVLQEAQRRGARLVVIDPRRTPLAKKADLHLQPRPGSDLPIALAILRWFFEEGHADWDFLAAHASEVAELRRRALPWTFERAAAVSGVRGADLLKFAEVYAESNPAVIRAGWGFERNRNGGSAVAATLALPAVAGKFGCRAGGYTLSNSGAWHLSAEKLVNEPESSAREINMSQLGAALVDAAPPVKVLFVYNCNPLATMPDQEMVRRGLARDDLFTVVFDSVRTDSTRYADLNLPATHFLEHHDLVRGYGAYVLQRVEPAVAPAGEARPNGEVFADLLHRLDLARDGEAESSAAFEAAILAPHPRVVGDLNEHGIAVPDGGPAPIQFVDTFPLTPDRRIHLVPEALDREAPGGLYHFAPDPATARHPLALLSPATSRTVSSTLGQLHRRCVPLEMHPDDAQIRGIRDGDRIRVHNDLGEVRTTVRLSMDVARGTVVLAKGLWSHNTLSGTTANALVPSSLSDLGGGACFNDARVEVAREVTAP